MSMLGTVLCQFAKRMQLSMPFHSMTPAHHVAVCLSSLLQLGVLVQHREACRSVMSFLMRLLDPSNALTKLQEQQHQQQRQLLGGTALDGSAAATALLQSQLDRVGANLSRMLLGAVVGALPYSRVGDIAPVVQVSRSSLSAVCVRAVLRCVSGQLVGRRLFRRREVYVLAESADGTLSFFSCCRRCSASDGTRRCSGCVTAWPPSQTSH